MLVIYGDAAHTDIRVSIFLMRTETQRAITAYPFDHPCNALCLSPSFSSLHPPTPAPLGYSTSSRVPFLFKFIGELLSATVEAALADSPVYRLHLSLSLLSLSSLISRHLAPPPPTSGLRSFSPLVFHKFWILFSPPGCNLAASRLYPRPGDRSLAEQVTLEFAASFTPIPIRRSRIPPCKLASMIEETINVSIVRKKNSLTFSRTRGGRVEEKRKKSKIECLFYFAIDRFRVVDTRNRWKELGG